MRNRKERSLLIPLLFVGAGLLALLILCTVPIATCKLCSGSSMLMIVEGEPGPRVMSLVFTIEAKAEVVACNRCNESGKASLLKNWTFDPSKPPKPEELGLTDREVRRIRAFLKPDDP